MLIGCHGDPPPKNPDADYVKLNATINNSAETLHLGDTLKITLTIPDTLQGVSQRIPVSSLQMGWYDCTFYIVDTVTKIGTRITSSNNIFISKGSFDGHGVYVSTAAKPYEAILNLVPPTKGVYYFQVTPQPGAIKINNSYEAGLRVNIATPDKHWLMYNNYFPGFYPGVTQFDNNGYAYYCFRVY